MTAEEFWKWAGGRRFALTVGAGIVHTLCLICGVMSEATYQVLTLSTVGAYIAANTTGKIMEKKPNA